ncbi:P-loop containing nucleoside triphosphate hydrolase protein, partial [Myxozyma melibiosi]
MAIRAREISGLIYHFMLYTAGSIIWYGTPLLLAVVTFSAYTLIAGHELKASVAFSCLSLINIVRKPIERLATSITEIMSAKVSLDRMQTFLEEEPTGKYRVLSVPRGPESPYIGFENASFTWGPRTDVGKFALWDLSIDFPVGKLTVVIGPTGSGKSSLLMALLGEMTLIEGNVFLPGLSTTSGIPSPLAGYTDTVAYCAQRPWLLNDSIRNNIVFGSAFDEARYFRVITACCLLPIFDSLEHGDLTIVGDKGITLSGGQKQRISLARAVYSSARHLLLDGCLGAIDAHSARTIFESCLSGPLMFGRTCILVSHNYTLTIPSASLVVALREGRVNFVGSPAEALEQGVLGSDRNLVKSSSLSTRSATPIEEAVAVEDEEEEEGQAAAARHNRFAVRRDSETLVRAESRKVGNVGLRTYLTYFSYVGSGKYLMLLLSVFVMQQVGDFGQNLWIRRWSQSAEIEREKERHDTGHYIRIYVLISSVYLLVSGARDGLAFHRSLNVSRRLFADMLGSVMYAIPSFFHTTPIGVIINRFSKDIETIDSILMPTLISITHSVISLLIILCVITVILPRFLFLLGFICAVFFVINRHFESTSVELRRMRLVTRSPLYQHFSETLSGLATIRAYGHESRFMLELMEKLDVHTRPYNAIWGCDRWMKFRCEVVGGLITAIAAGFIIWKGELIDAGLAGLCLTYAANFTGEISDLMAVNAMNETNMNSVERVEEFLEIEQEAPAVVESSRPPAGWPSAGAVVVSNLSLRYAAHLPRVVDGISFEVKGGWKVGIVGRTGAGKSTIASAFFRFLEAEEGRIVIDGFDVRGIGLRDLRQALSIIPQDPILFSGTIRSNLDPNDQYSDEEIERVLERVKLMKRSDEGELEGRIAGLNTVVSESGSNLSQGQRQLVCLARSLLKKTKVMFLDEATAAIDYATDEILQRTIRREFRQTTIFTIAHRLRSVIDYDRILVLETGRVVEYGSPVELIESRGGVFRRMCESSGAMELLEEMARGGLR